MFFYDLTSSYFEGQARANAKARRGYSRDSRPDCKQVVIGLVVGREGFPLAHEVFEGNTADRQSLAPMLEALAARVPLVAGQTVVVDRGMAFEDNPAAIRARGLHYVVASRQSERGRWFAEFDSLDGFTEITRSVSPNTAVQRTSKVWVLRRQTETEVHILCRSEAHIAKDRATCGK